MGLNLKPCPFCGETEKLSRIEKEVSGGGCMFVECGECLGSAKFFQWQHPVMQPNKCLVCACRETEAEN